MYDKFETIFVQDIDLVAFDFCSQQLNEDIRNLSSISLATSMPETCSLSKDSNGCVTNDVQSSVNRNANLLSFNCGIFKPHFIIYFQLENQSSQTNQNVTITKAIEVSI